MTIMLKYVPYVDYVVAFICIVCLFLICVKKVSYLQKSNAVCGLLFTLVATLAKCSIDLIDNCSITSVCLFTCLHLVSYFVANLLFTTSALRLIVTRDDILNSLYKSLKCVNWVVLLSMIPVYLLIFFCSFQNTFEVIWLIVDAAACTLSLLSCECIAGALVSRNIRLSKWTVVSLHGLFIFMSLLNIALVLLRDVTYTSLFLVLPTCVVVYYFGRNAYNSRDGLYDTAMLHEMTKELADSKYHFYAVIFSREYLLEHPNVIQTITQANCKAFRKHMSFLYHGYLLITLIPEHSNNFYRCMHSVVEYVQDSEIANDSDYKVIVSDSIDKELSLEEIVDFSKFMARKFTKADHYVLCNRVNNREYNRYRTIVENLMDISYGKNPTDERVLVYMQPVLWINEDKLLSAESLMRLRLPDCTIIEPNEFIPIAERIGCIHEFSLIILHKVCIQINQMLGDDLEFHHISVNFSLSELHKDKFLDDVKKVLNVTGTDPKYLAFEITETLAEHDHELVKSIMTEIKDLGISMYLDDFGTGYSNFERILSLPFDVIKFDKSLTDLSKQDTTSFYMISHFADIFAHSNFKILFEGVEDATDETRCITMSADYLQGYRYAKPKPIEDVKYFFKRKE